MRYETFVQSDLDWFYEQPAETQDGLRTLAGNVAAQLNYSHDLAFDCVVHVAHAFDDRKPS
jgi:hypothetical protein